MGGRLICSPGWRTSGFAQNHAVPDPQCPVLGGVHLPGAAHTAHTAETPPGRSEGSHRWALGKQGPGHVLNGGRRLQTNGRDSARGRRGLGRTSPARALAPPLGTPFCGVFGREGGTETSRVVGFGPGRGPPALSGETGPRRLRNPRPRHLSRLPPRLRGGPISAARASRQTLRRSGLRRARSDRPLGPRTAARQSFFCACTVARTNLRSLAPCLRRDPPADPFLSVPWNACVQRAVCY